MAGNLGKTRSGASPKKKKPVSKAPPPSRTSREEHKGKIPGAGGLAEVPKEEVAGPYRSESSVPSIKKKATKREHRKVTVETKESRNRDVFQGKAKPTTKHEKIVAQRGKALRKLLRYNKGNLPSSLQGVKQTGVVRESQLQAVEKQINEVSTHLQKKQKELNPKEHKELRSQLIAARAEKNRLVARKYMSFAYKAKKQQNVIKREFKPVKQGIKQLRKEDKLDTKQAKKLFRTQRKLTKRLGKQAKQHEEQAKREFAKSERKNERAAKLATQVDETPRITKTKTVRYLKGVKETGRGPLGQPLLFKTPRRIKSYGKKRVFYVPKQKQSGASEEGYFGGGWYDRKQIEALTKEMQEAKNAPTTLGVGVTAASLATAPFAPELAVLKYAGLGVKALQATKGAEAIATGAKALGLVAKSGKNFERAYELAKTARAAKGAVKVAKSAKEAALIGERPAYKLFKGRLPTTDRLARDFEKDVKVIKVAKGGKKAESISEPTISIGTKNLEKALVHAKATPKETNVALELASSPGSKAGELLAKDRRVIAGAGAVDDVAHSMALSKIEQISKVLYPTGRLASGIGLRVKRAGIKTGIGAVPIFIGSSIDGDFRENALRDVNDLVHGFIPSTYEFLTASGQAIAYGVSGVATAGTHHVGSTNRIEAIWDGLLKTSPVALALQGKFSQAEKALKERPVTGLIELGGAYTAVGRGAGIVGRALPGEVGATGGRSSIPIFGNVEEIRTYSENLITKQLEKLGDKKADAFLRGLHPKFDPITGKHVESNFIRTIKSRDIGQKMVIKLEHRIDEFDAITKISGRADFSLANKSVTERLKELHREKRIPKAERKNVGNAITVAAMRIARSPETAIADIKAYKTKIAQEVERLKTERIPENSPEIQRKIDTIAVLDQALKTPELFKQEKFWKATEAMQEAESVRQQGLVAAGALDEAAMQMAPWVPYMVNHMGAKFSKSKGYFEIKRKGKNEQVTLDEVKAHAKANGVRGEPMMISAREVDGADYENLDVLTNPSADTMATTGDYISNGNVDLSVKSILNQTSISQTILHRRKVRATALDRFSMTEPNSTKPVKFTSKEAAFNAAKHMNKELGFDLVPMKGYHGKDWRLVPKLLDKRLRDHKKYEKILGNIFRRMNNEFKGSVLAFSPKWHIGNVVDMSMRLMFEGAGVRSYHVGREFLKEVEKLDPAAYNDILSTILGGHYAATHDMIDKNIDLSGIASKEAQQVRLAYQDAYNRTSSSAIRLGKEGYEKLFHGVIRGYRGFQRGSFKAGGFLEHHLKTTALGKAVLKEAERTGNRNVGRQLANMSIRWDKAVKLQPDVLEKMALGIIENDNVLAHYGKYVNKIMGDYTTMSPEMRGAIMSVVPFGLWLRASTKWALSLPGNSPIRTAMISSVNRLNKEDREKLGLSPLALGGGLESYLQGSLPGNTPNKLVRTNSYTSFGPLMDFSALAGFAAPQVKMIVDAVRGEDWLGNPIVNQYGKELGIRERLGVATQQLLEAYVAPFGIAHTLIAQGTPDPSFSVLNNLLNLKSPVKGVKERQFFRQKRYNRDEPIKVTQSEAEPFELSAKSGILAKEFLPTYETDNPFVQNRQYQKKQKAEEKSGTSEELTREEWALGSKAKSKTKKDKRTKSHGERIGAWVGE